MISDCVYDTQFYKPQTFLLILPPNESMGCYKKRSRMQVLIRNVGNRNGNKEQPLCSKRLYICTDHLEKLTNGKTIHRIK